MKITIKNITITSLATIIFIILYFYFLSLGNILKKNYDQIESTKFTDRHGQNISITPNNLGNYCIFTNEIGDNFQNKLLQKEDKYFFYHFGINPISITRSTWGRVINKKTGGSTLSQQLAKILLNQENKRNIKNKIKELSYSIGLEIATSKKEILIMYINSVYFGNNIQGIEAASQYYFNKTANSLNDQEIEKLLITINNPSNINPFLLDDKNKNYPTQQKENESNKKIYFKKYISGDATFEVNNILKSTKKTNQLTIDQNITKNLRQIIKRNLVQLANKNTDNAAVVVINTSDNSVLSIVGSPDPTMENYGYQINMATKMRPIGSTIKPLLYLKGFKNGLRPYTLINDREYKYIINDGFAFYPKNYDYKYHGIVNLHYALSNSLNVPSVKVLEYIGIQNFNNWLTNDLNFNPQQNIDSYQLGIALGGLEMDLLSLSYYFTIFANHGNLSPLKIDNDNNTLPMLAADFSTSKKISDDKYVQLVNKILSDRLTGVEQFGLKSSLNIPNSDYGVKTGTSREYHDSWTVGYTPDFVIGVWVGNSNNTAMDQVSGQTGAGRIWNESMNLLLNSEYNHHRHFTFENITDYQTENGQEYGLPGDNLEKATNLLMDNELILKPHDGDIFLFNQSSKIQLQSSYNVKWIIDEKQVGTGENITISQPLPGQHILKATYNNNEQTISFKIKKEE